MRRKWVVTAGAIAALAAPALYLLVPDTGAGARRIAVLYTGETLGELEQCECGGTPAGGLPFRGGYLSEQAGRDPLLLDVGCVGNGARDFEVLRAEAVLRGMKEMGYHASNIGETEAWLGIEGIRRFLQRAWRLLVGDDRTEPAPRTPEPAKGEARRQIHVAIAGVTADMEALGFNTAIAKLMTFLTAMHDMDPLPEEAADVFLRMLGPFAPHMVEEIWERLGKMGLAADATWPVHDEAALETATIELAVQVNGKVRDRVTVGTKDSDANVIAKARALPKVAVSLEGKTVVKEMVVPGRLVVFTVRG